MAAGLTVAPDEQPRSAAAAAAVAALGVLALGVLAAQGLNASEAMVRARPAVVGIVLAGAGAHAALLGRRIERPLVLIGLGWLVVLAIHQLVLGDRVLGSTGDILRAGTLLAPLDVDLRGVSPDLWVVAVVAWGWAFTALVAIGHERARDALALDVEEMAWVRRATTGTLLAASALVPPVQPFLLGRLVAEERAALRSRRAGLVAAAVLVVSASVALSLELRVVVDVERWLGDGFVAPSAALVGASVVALALRAGPAWSDRVWVRRSSRPLGSMIVAHWLAVAVVLDRLDSSSSIARAEVAVTITVAVALGLTALDPRTTNHDEETGSLPPSDAAITSSSGRADAAAPDPAVQRP